MTGCFWREISNLVWLSDSGSVLDKDGDVNKRQTCAIFRNVDITLQMTFFLFHAESLDLFLLCQNALFRHITSPWQMLWDVIWGDGGQRKKGTNNFFLFRNRKRKQRRETAKRPSWMVKYEECACRSRQFPWTIPPSAGSGKAEVHPEKSEKARQWLLEMRNIFNTSLRMYCGYLTVGLEITRNPTIPIWFLIPEIFFDCFQNNSKLIWTGIKNIRGRT